MKILIFGLPGSGKTTFAKKLCKDLDVAYFNADEIRTIFSDWDFSPAARTRQAIRMERLTKLTTKNCIVDFVCPFDDYRKYYDITVWMNTIEFGRYEDTNKIFERPSNSNYIIDDYNYDKVIKELCDRLE
jgi:adenylylsulfate kinase-like enzyme